jgi:Tfp pilus assembly protein PilV
MGRPRHRLRRLGAEDGFALIEVMAAAVLLLVVSLATLAVFDTSQQVSSRTRARTVAADLAQQDQDRMRGMRAFDLSNYHWSHAVAIDHGGSYTVDSRADWIRDASGVESCTVNNSQADYLRITSTVSSSAMTKPVTMASLVAPPVAAFDANRGTLTVKVTDRDGDPLSGADVAISGPTSLGDTTNSLGCAVFSHIPVGTYSATTHKFGYVDPNGNDPGAVTGTPIVTAGKVTVVPGQLDDAATVTATFDTYVNAYAAASNGGTTGFIASQAQAMTADPATASDPSQLTSPGGWQDSLSDPALFPFAAGYSVYTGSCPNADPSKYISNYYASNPGTVATDPGVESSVAVHQAPLPVQVQNALGAAQANAHVVATGSASGGCPADTFTLTTDGNGLVTHAGGTFDPGVPFGSYDVCVDVRLTSTRWLRKTTANVPAKALTGISSPTVIQLPPSTTTSSAPCS